MMTDWPPLIAAAEELGARADRVEAEAAILRGWLCELREELKVARSNYNQIAGLAITGYDQIGAALRRAEGKE